MLVWWKRLALSSHPEGMWSCICFWGVPRYKDRAGSSKPSVFMRSVSSNICNTLVRFGILSTFVRYEVKYDKRTERTLPFSLRISWMCHTRPIWYGLKVINLLFCTDKFYCEYPGQIYKMVTRQSGEHIRATIDTRQWGENTRSTRHTHHT